MNILEFAEKYQSKYGKPLEAVPVGNATLSMSAAESKFGSKIFRMDPTNNFVAGSNLLSISGSQQRFGLEIASLVGITRVSVLYNGRQTPLPSVPKLLFFCAGNSLKIVPDEMSKMDNIFCLFLKGNQITHIPTEFPPIPRIYLNVNKITSLPDSIYHAQLEKFGMGNNPIYRISPLIGKCTRLMHCDLDNIGLGVLPAEIGNCVKLRVFSACSNNLSAIPATFVQKVAVANEVRFDDNPKITQIPFQPGYAWGRMTATLSISKTGIDIADLPAPLKSRVKSSFKDDADYKYRDHAAPKTPDAAPMDTGSSDHAGSSDKDKSKDKDSGSKADDDDDDSHDKKKKKPKHQKSWFLKYKWYIIAGVVAVLLLLIIVIYLRYKRKKARLRKLKRKYRKAKKYGRRRPRRSRRSQRVSKTRY